MIDTISIVMQLFSVKFHHIELSLLSSADVDFLIDALCVSEV